MSLSKPANDFINLFYTVINDVKSNNTKSDKILKELYKKIYLSNKYAELFIKNNEITKKTIDINTENKIVELSKYSLLKQGTFIPNHVKKRFIHPFNQLIHILL